MENFEKARKVFKPIRKETASKKVIKSEIEIRRTVEEKKIKEENMKVIKEFMHDIMEEDKNNKYKRRRIIKVINIIIRMEKGGKRIERKD